MVRRTLLICGAYQKGTAYLEKGEKEMSKLFIAICALTFVVSAQAQTAKPKKKVKTTVTTTTTTEEVDDDGSLYDDKGKTVQIESDESSPRTPYLPSKNEDWYTLWGFGFSSVSYSGNLGDAYETLGDAYDRSSTVNADLFGFYWPSLTPNTIMGVNLNIAADSIEGLNVDAALRTYLLAFSTYHFFGTNIGDGWFVRGDVGFTHYNVEFKAGVTDLNKSSDRELGIMFGGGYAFAISDETRVLFGLYIRPIPELEKTGDTLKGTVTNFTAGFLF